MKRPHENTRTSLADTTNLLEQSVVQHEQSSKKMTPWSQKKAVLQQNNTHQTIAYNALKNGTTINCPTKITVSSSLQQGNSKKNVPIPQKRRTTTSSTPYQTWKGEFQLFLNTHGFLGSLLIRGIKGANSPIKSHSTTSTSSTLDGDNDRSSLTRQQLQDLRYILITQSRADKLDAIHVMLFTQQTANEETPVVFYDQHGSFGRQVYQVWHTWNRRIMFNAKNQSDRLDWLIALTYTLHEWDAWMYDHPYADDDDTMTTMVQSLAGTWRRLFDKEINANANLGWDPQFTKPGVMELLSQFRIKVGECAALGPFEYAVVH